MWTSDNDGPFIDQEYVDEYVRDTIPYAQNCSSEEDAVKLLRRVKYLQYVSDSFFVPEMVIGWEEMALAYIESAEAVFKYVQYEIIKQEHHTFFEAVRELEESVLSNLLSKEELFSMVKEFNDNIEGSNLCCEKYGMIKFTKYWFKHRLLQNDYDKWIEVEGYGLC